MNAPFDQLFGPQRKARAKARDAPPFRRRILFEALEPRLLLSADVGANAVADMLAAALAEYEQAAQQQLDSGSGPLLVFAGPQATVHADPTAGTWIIELASGERALQAGDTDNVWRITGADTGTLNGEAFSGIGILIGGADNEDTFIFEAGGSLSGYLEGGAGGFDTLVLEGGHFASGAYAAGGPDSGTVELDGNLIRFFGLEPIIDNADTADRVFTGTAGADHIRLKDAGAGSLTIESLNGTFESITFARPSSSLTIEGGDGDDVYEILATNWGELRIAEAAGGGNDTLDLAAHPNGLPAGSAIEYVGEAPEQVDGVQVDSVALLAGLDKLVAWADTLDNAGTLGQALAVLKGNVGVGLGASLDLADVFDQLRLEIKAFVDDPANGPLTSDKLAALLAAFQKTEVTHFDRAIVGETRSPALAAEDEFSFILKLDSEAQVSLADVKANADLVESLNAAIGTTALLGRVQAIRTDDGRIGFRVIDASVDKFTLTATEGGAKLGYTAGAHTKENLTKVLGGLGKLNVGVEGAVVPELITASDGTQQLRFRFHYAADRTSQFNIDLGEEAEKKSVSFDPGTSLKVKTALDAELALGVTLGASQQFFLDVGSFDLSATSSGNDTNLTGDLKIGFLGASLVDPVGPSDPEPRISLFAGVELDGAVDGLAAFDASDQAAMLDSLAHDPGNALDIDLPIKVKEGIPGFAPEVRISFQSEDDAVPFTGRLLPLVDLPDGTAGDSFDNIGNAALFGRIDPTGFVQLVGQVRDFLAKVSDSDLFAKFDIPFNTAPLAKIAELGDTFFRAVMFDDGRDGKDDTNDKKLVTDLNKALKDAGLDALIRASIDVASSKVVLTAISSTVAGFSLTSGAGNELGFGASQTASRGSPADRLTLAGAPLGASHPGTLNADTSFVLTVTKTAGDSVTKTITVTKAAADDNTALGNDVEKLLDTSNAATFSNAQELVARIKQMATGSSGNEDKPVEPKFEDGRFSVTFDLSHEFEGIDIPIDFDLDLSPLGNVSAAGSPEIHLGGEIGFKLTLGVDLNDTIAGSASLTEETRLADLKDIDVFTDLVKTSYALTAAAVAPVTVESVEVTLDRLSVTGVEFSNAAAAIAVKAESLINGVLNLTSPEGTVLWIKGSGGNGRTQPLPNVPSPDFVAGSYVSPRLEFDLRIDTQNGALHGETFHVVVPEKSYSVATESQFKLRWLPDIEKAIVAAQNSAASSTITRTDGSSWEGSGFRAGQSIDVSSAGLNDGTYTIDSIDGDTLTLVEDLKANGADADAKVEGPGTASLPASESWSDLQYQEGQRVTISGSTAGNDGTYVIEVIDGARSVIFDQAENRMHAQNALMVHLLGAA